MALSDAGFVSSVDVQDMNDLSSLADQASWFASHDIILAVHGGALTNAIFIQPAHTSSTIVISLYPPGYYCPSLIQKAGGIPLDCNF
mmetsp:Transcript_10639/g.17601  ORF Transcript_10639/g.17601 Transcript_10639/m.17601 type:complete len:87 (+) Transcript_10639:327-587(+)